MSHAPFPTGNAGPLDPFDPPLAPRVSTMAIASLVFGLLCCIPGSGLIATILGGSALVRIGSSQGRLTGRGMAFTALVLGLLGTVFYLFVGIGASQVAQMFGRYGQQTAQAITSGDSRSLRGMLSASASASLTDEQAQTFFKEVSERAGKFDRLPRGIMAWINDFAAAQPLVNAAGLKAGDPKETRMPIPAHFDRGLSLIIVEVDQGARGAGLFRNLGVQPPTGATIWLMPPGAPAVGPGPGAPKSLPAPTPPPATSPAPPAGEPAPAPKPAG